MAFFARRFAWALALPPAALAVVAACVGGDATPPAEVSCVSYCAQIQQDCTGDDLQYPDNATCQRVCATFGGVPSGNTIQCRLSALSNRKDAPTAAERHFFCSAAGLASAACPSRCESFCNANLALCGPGTVPNSRYADVQSCQSACAGFRDANPDAGFSGALLGSTGDTVECRSYHLELSQTGLATDKETHCPHTTAPNKVRCNDAPPGDGGVTDGAADAGTD